MTDTVTDVTGYPPEPWYLGGTMNVSVFLVSEADLPAGCDLPNGRRPLRVGSRVVVGVAAVRYLPGGVLDYDELLIAVPSLGRGGFRVTIPQIWVDSATSRQGGRELWGIPKELAEFTGTERAGATSMSMTVDSNPVAAVRARRGLPLLPGMRQLALPILQRLDGRLTLSHNRVIGRMSGLRASWRFAATGPLGYLHGRRPLLSLALHDAAIIFGMDVTRS
ncbi:acetoacetate decarboxylase family protein [Cryobacterium arcticum]|uniref:acetoacetate decarboxylase family protein n=1 Tax=Cryobacterium arcticum TaxID=670052 RepID=UPI001C641291|nr:acetoacetate decarboxylase family protein [Cryobacterium arcticum]